jgi:tRNA nucleotidyltransferase (CCA-adding enzyme)
MLLGRQPKDVDILVVGANDEVMNLLDREGSMVGVSFPVWLVDGVEIALARTERKSGAGYAGFVCVTGGVTLEQDLQRRDLTINAMALDPFTDRIIDPYGGAADLANKVLYPVGEHFGEDPVRILRAARFAAQLDMKISGALVRAAEPALAELMDEPGERLWGELEKALRTQRPSKFIEGLDVLGALDVVLPEIAALKGRIQPEKHHPEGCVATHTCLALDRGAQLNANIRTMFGILVHDLGKAITPDDNLPHHYDHEALGVPLVHKMCDRLCVPNNVRLVAALATKEHLNIHRFIDLRPVKKVRLLDRLRIIHDSSIMHDVALVAQADAQGRGPIFIDKPYPQKDALLKAAKAYTSVTGHQFSHLENGKKIAQKLETARIKALQDGGS